MSVFVESMLVLSTSIIALGICAIAGILYFAFFMDDDNDNDMFGG